MTNKSEIADFYKNKNVFITGGSGFIGKCLIEKLLRSCPDVGKIYMLLRPRKGTGIDKRVEKMISNMLFDEVRKKNPEVLTKIIPIKGDVAELELGSPILFCFVMEHFVEVPNIDRDTTCKCKVPLEVYAEENNGGLSKEDRQTLIENVNVIFHTAASVRFDDSLKDAILTNIRSSREIAELALDTKNLSVLLHTSTTYCNIDKKVVEEKLYPSYGYWRDAIILAEEGDESLLDALTVKYITPFPNTYTFTKLMAEHCINELCAGKIPTVIYRPSVVISSLEEPFTGFIDNFNGPVGLLLAGGAGLLRVVYGDVHVRTDYITVDLTVKAMITAAWDKANTLNAKNEVAVYNGSKNGVLPIQQGYLVVAGKKLYWDVPFEKKIWFPRNRMTSCFYEYYLHVILFHMIPAVFLDLLLRIFGRKPMFFKIQRKIYIGNMAVSYFMFNEWAFINDKHQALNDRMTTDKDRELFGFRKELLTEDDLYDYYLASCKMAKHLLLKESIDIKPETYVNTKRMYYLDIFVKTIFWVTAAYLVFYRFNIFRVICRGVQAYWDSLEGNKSV